jgi:hypothetical protein
MGRLPLSRLPLKASSRLPLAASSRLPLAMMVPSR